MSHAVRIALALAALLPSTASAQLYADTFTQPDGTFMGPDWVEVSGDLAITTNEGHGDLSSGWSKMQHGVAMGDPLKASARITLLPPSGSSGPHVALVFGDGGARNLYTKIQDNDSDGQYDRIFFYSADNGTGYGTFSAGITPILTARVEMYLTNDGDTMNVDIDRDFDGVVDEHVESSGISGFAADLGTGFAVGTWAMGRFDDWQVDLTPTVGISGAPADISLSGGGIQTLDMQAPLTEAGRPYLLLGTHSGTTPGIPYEGFTIPLSFDPYFFHTLGSPNTPPLANSFGTLDNASQAQATFTVPGGSNPAFAGIVFDHAYVVFDPVTFQLTYASGPVSATLTP